MTRIRLTVSYKGTNFRGFAEQPGDIPTVAGLLRASLERVLRSPLVLTCAGRTDAGVHAHGQVVTFDISDDAGPPDLERLTRSVNKQIMPDVVITGAAVVDDQFNARFSAKFRRYLYRIHNAPVPDPLQSDVAWWVAQPLDVDAMNQAGSQIVGEHDFSAFCRRPDPEAILVRRVEHARWERQGEMVVLDIQANAFCHQMVRSLVGHMVEIGRGRVPDLAEVLQSKDRNQAANPAPPQGLVLSEVGY